MTEIISVTIMNLAAPKAGVKHELLFNKPASETLHLQNLSWKNSETEKFDPEVSWSDFKNSLIDSGKHYHPRLGLSCSNLAPWST